MTGVPEVSGNTRCAAGKALIAVGAASLGTSSRQTRRCRAHGQAPAALQASELQGSSSCVGSSGSGATCMLGRPMAYGAAGCLACSVRGTARSIRTGLGSLQGRQPAPERAERRRARGAACRRPASGTIGLEEDCACQSKAPVGLARSELVVWYRFALLAASLCQPLPAKHC